MSHDASPSRIRILPPLVANQIAAGEVVERPASVVKELLENSLDAQAHTIEIDVEKGGVQRIRITDDGLGIHRDDLPLALSPHATSKIATAHDLDAVSSLGFRGEALASISSVSRLSLSSRPLGEEWGWQFGGELSEPRPVAMQHGTEIEMTELFYNTPARRKFLRSERTEFVHLEEVVRRIALSRFDVTVRLTHNGKQVLRVKAARSLEEQQRRVSEVLGKHFFDNSRSVERAIEGMRLWGWIGTGDYSRSHADTLYFYLNGRVVRDRLLAHAVRLAFGDLIPEGRFPAYLLYLELEPQQVDVNVHPTKHEVRFREARQVHDFIYWVVKNALGAGETSTAVATGVQGVLAAAGGALPASYRSPLRPAVAEQGAGYRLAAGKVGGRPETAGKELLLGRAQLQLRSGYLLAERGDVSVVIDLRALLEAVTFARLQSPLVAQQLVPQPLLIPYSCELTAQQAAVWQQEGGRLGRYGFEWDWLGEQLLVLRQVPALLRTATLGPLIVPLTRWLAEKEGEEAMFRLLAGSAHADPLPSYAMSELNALLREYESTMGESSERHWRVLDRAGWRHLIESQ